MLLRVVSLFCFIVASTNVAQTQTKKACTMDEEKQADTEASTLKTWREVYSSYKSFIQCDDGSIGEGYSDSVARLLSEHWNTTGELLQLVSRDKDFEQFVMRHIDELMSLSQGRKIRENASSHCPAQGVQMCKSIISKLKKISPVVKP
jgi:hypothetical protein